MLIEYCKKMNPKKFNKILCKLDIKGLVKLCDTYERADLILIYIPGNFDDSMFLSKGSYQEEKDKLPENAIVCYVKHTNPYNKQKVTQSFLKAKCGYTRK